MLLFDIKTDAGSKLVQAITQVLPTLPKPEQELLISFLKKAMNERDLFYIMEWLRDPIKWERPMVSLDTFLDSEYYLNIGSTVYPKVREIARDILEGGYKEGVLIAGIGAGKSFMSELISCYVAHKLICMRSPHQAYNLTADKNITIINMGTSASQALGVVFTGIRTMVQGCQFFQEYQPNIKVGSITFEDKLVALMSGNSKSTTPLGQNTFCGVLDEAAFYMDNDSKSIAQDIYEALQRRITSRFGTDGLLIMISSPRYIGDFIMRKYDEAKEKRPDGTLKYPEIYSLRLPSWKVKESPKQDLGKKPFHFHVLQSRILADPVEKIKEKGWRVNSIKDPGFGDEYDVWEVPSEYRTSFMQNAERAKRDYGATPTAAIDAFFPDAEKVMDAFNPKRKDMIMAPGKYDLDKRPQRVPYYVHIDIGLNKNGGDHTGFCMGHFGGWKEINGERHPIVYIDVMEQIGAESDTGEVSLEKIRHRIYDLKKAGYNIACVSYDGYQSRDSMQQLSAKGFNAQYLSVDRDMEPYNLLKSCFYLQTVDIPYNEALYNELIRLEVLKGKKVDHSPESSKDMSDALAGVMYHVVTNNRNYTTGVGVGIRMPNSALGDNKPLTATEKAKQKQELFDQMVAIQNGLLYGEDV